MSHLKRLILILLVTALLFPPLLKIGSSEDMTFTVYCTDGMWRLYHLSEDLIPELLCEAANYISYEDGAAAYVGCPDSVRWDLIAEKNGEITILMEGTANSHNYKASHLKLVDGTIYVPLHTITENNEIIDTPLLVCSLDGTQQRVITDMNLTAFGSYHVEDEIIYYLEQDTWMPMVYDLKQGEKRPLPELEPISIAPYTYMDSGLFWYAWADGDLGDYYEHKVDEIHIYLVGLSAHSDQVIKVPFDEWLENGDYYIHDGWLYFFRNRRLSNYEDPADTVADLYRRNIKTMEETCICTDITYDNNFPPTLTFGKKGIIYEDFIWEGDKSGYVQKLWYVPYDGSGLVELSLS